jgi:hypothetical protein
MKDLVELEAVIMKINGKKKTFKKNNFELQGWACEDADNMESDSGVILRLKDGKKRYKISL